MNEKEHKLSTIVVGEEMICPEEVLPVVKLNEKRWNSMKEMLSGIADKYPLLVWKGSSEEQLLQILSFSPHTVNELAKSMHDEWIEMDINRVYVRTRHDISSILKDRWEYEQDTLILSQIINNKFSDKNIVFHEWSASIAWWHTSINKETFQFLQRDDIKILKDNTDKLKFSDIPNGFESFNSNDRDWLDYILKTLKKLDIVNLSSIEDNWVSRNIVKEKFEKKYPYQKIRPYIESKNNLKQLSNYIQSLAEPLEDAYWAINFKKQ